MAAKPVYMHKHVLIWQHETCLPADCLHHWFDASADMGWSTWDLILDHDAELFMNLNIVQGHVVLLLRDYLCRCLDALQNSNSMAVVGSIQRRKTFLLFSPIFSEIRWGFLDSWSNRNQQYVDATSQSVKAGVGHANTVWQCLCVLNTTTQLLAFEVPCNESGRFLFIYINENSLCLNLYFENLRRIHNSCRALIWNFQVYGLQNFGAFERNSCDQ